MRKQITLNAQTVFTAHLAVIAALLACHTTVAVADAFGAGRLFGLRNMFLLTHERNVPTLISALALLACAGGAALNRLWAAPGRDARDWLVTALVFTFLAFDEACQIHELFNKIPVRDLQPFHYVWVFPYAVAVACFVAWLLPFLARLPRPTRRGLLLGFGVFVGSALGMELIEGALATRFREAAYDQWWMTVLNTVEETGEFVGVAILLRSLLFNLPDGQAMEVAFRTRPGVAAARAQRPRVAAGNLSKEGPDGL